MSERSVRCPDCRFSFAKLVDAGDFHAYVCHDCGWTKPTEDRRPGNRPADVCALCDTAIDLSIPNEFHLYWGSGWVHGGGREYIPIHHRCADGARAYLKYGVDNDDCCCPGDWQKRTGEHMSYCFLSEPGTRQQWIHGHLETVMTV